VGAERWILRSPPESFIRKQSTLLVAVGEDATIVARSIAEA